MSDVLIIPWARTDWADQSLLIGRTGLPLNQAGRAAVAALADSLASGAPQTIRSGPEESAHETAVLLAARFDLRPGRPVRDLAEVSLGVWAGLSLAQIEQRFTSAYEEWRDHPESVCPPEGELLADAAERLYRSLQRLIRRHSDERLAVVVGPMAAAALRCRMVDQAFQQFWRYYEPFSEGTEPVFRIATAISHRSA